VADPEMSKGGEDQENFQSFLAPKPKFYYQILEPYLAKRGGEGCVISFFFFFSVCWLSHMYDTRYKCDDEDVFIMSMCYVWIQINS
jgi:hypothetical protein